MAESAEQAARRLALAASRGGGKLCPPSVKNLLNTDTEELHWMATDFLDEGVHNDQKDAQRTIWVATFDGILEGVAA